MADWSALVKGFQEGADFSQRFRANRQFEKARDLSLEGGEYDMQSRRANRKIRDPMTEGVFGKLDAGSVQDYQGLPDPFAFKLFDYIKSKVKGKKKQAIPGGEITPTDSVSQSGMEEAPAPVTTTPYAMGEEAGPVEDLEGYADGGSIDDDVKKRAKEYRERTRGSVQNATEEVRGADRTARAPQTPKGMARRAIDATGRGLRGAVNSGAGRLVGGAVAGSAILDQTDDDYDSRIAKRFGWDEYSRDEQGNVVPDSFPKYFGKRLLGYASDLGAGLMPDSMTNSLYADKREEAAAQQAPPQAAAPAAQAAAPQRMALPTTEIRAKPAAPARQQAVSTDPQMVDFADFDGDPREVPDMKTGDWKKYRAEVMDAARLSGNPEAVARANDMVTDMQQKGFLNYAQQGLALQQAGNTRAAMAAYRAAYQYFPNGHDVEFGVHNGRIIGFGKDEKTGKVVPKSEIVMDPERVSVLIENFKNPQAFRTWTTDWRDFQQKERQYKEVTKPLAQAQANALSNRSEADILRAENSQLKAGQNPGAGAAMRNAEHVFRQRVEMLGIQDEAQADYLASVMSQIKASNPNVPDNAIVQAIMQAQRDGSLKQRLQQLGIQ